MTNEGTAPLLAGVLVFDAVEELDFVGPWEVLGMAAKTRLPIAARLVAATTAPVRSACGLRVLPDHGFADAPAFDILIVPGGQGTRPGVEDAALVGFVAAAAARATWVASVCTGAALLGRAGLLDGRRATTHWLSMDFVAANAPKATLVKDERVVFDGNVVTSAGVSAGIDMTLSLLGRIFGAPAALSVQEKMEYYPEPPFGGRHPVTGRSSS
jgi:transcriptional regulator GlxA family with amidase domain